MVINDIFDSVFKTGDYALPATPVLKSSQRTSVRVSARNQDIENIQIPVIESQKTENVSGPSFSDPNSIFQNIFGSPRPFNPSPAPSEVIEQKPFTLNEKVQNIVKTGVKKGMKSIVSLMPISGPGSIDPELFEYYTKPEDYTKIPNPQKEMLDKLALNDDEKMKLEQSGIAGELASEAVSIMVQMPLFMGAGAAGQGTIRNLISKIPLGKLKTILPVIEKVRPSVFKTIQETAGDMLGFGVLGGTEALAQGGGAKDIFDATVGNAVMAGGGRIAGTVGRVLSKEAPAIVQRAASVVSGAAGFAGGTALTGGTPEDIFKATILGGGLGFMAPTSKPMGRKTANEPAIESEANIPSIPPRGTEVTEPAGQKEGIIPIERVVGKPEEEPPINEEQLRQELTEIHPTPADEFFFDKPVEEVQRILDPNSDIDIKTIPENVRKEVIDLRADNYRDEVSVSLDKEMETLKSDLEQKTTLYNLTLPYLKSMNKESFARAGDINYNQGMSRWLTPGGSSVDAVRMSFLSRYRGRSGINENKLETPSDFVQFLSDIPTREEIKTIESKLKGLNYDQELTDAVDRYKNDLTKRAFPESPTIKVEEGDLFKGTFFEDTRSETQRQIDLERQGRAQEARSQDIGVEGTPLFDKNVQEAMATKQEDLFGGEKKTNIQPPIKLPVPSGWKVKQGYISLKEDRTPFEAEIDWKDKSILFLNKRYENDPEYFNHEIAHVMAEEHPKSKEFFNDFLDAYSDYYKKKGYEPSWIKENNFHREDAAIFLGKYLTDRNSINVPYNVKSVFEKYFPENKISAMQKEPSPLTMGGISAQPGPLPKYALSTNLERWDAPFDVKKNMLEMTADYQKSFEERTLKGTSHQMIKDIANSIGNKTIEKRLMARQKGENFNVFELKAARDLAVSVAQRRVDIQREINSKGGLNNLSESEKFDYLMQLKKGAAIAAEVNGLSSEAGRLLNSLKISAEARKLNEDVSQMLMDFEGGKKTGEEILSGFMKIGDNVKAQNNFLSRALLETVPDKIHRYFIESILSAFPTHAANFISNTATNLTRLTIEKPLSIISEKAVSKIQGRKAERFFGEIPAEAIGMVRGFNKAIETFKNTLVTGQTAWSSPIETLPTATGKKLGMILPTHWLAAADDFFKQVTLSGELHSLAYRQAKMEGLSKSQIPKRMQDILELPTPEMWSKARTEAEYRTFTGKPGQITSAIMKVRRVIPGARYIIPFLNTPMKIMKYGLERTPGTSEIMLYQKLKRGELKGTELSDQLGKMIFSHLVAIPVVIAARSGLITGSGPQNKEEKANLYRTGWLPYSLKLGNKYYSYSRMEPISTVLGLIADFSTLDEGGNNDIKLKNVANRIGYAIQQNITNKTFFEQLSNVLDATHDFGTYGERFLAKFSGSLIPNIISKGAAIWDEYYRNSKNIIDIMKSRSPILSNTLFPERDIWGKPIEKNLSGIYGFFSPIAIKKERNDLVDKEMVRLSLRISGVSNKINKVELTDEQKDEYAQLAGEKAYKLVSNFVSSSGYSSLSDDNKKEGIRQRVERAREIIRNAMISKYKLK